MTSNAIATQATKKRSTPQWLKLGLIGTWGLSSIVLLISIVGVQNQRNAIKTIGEDAAPSVLMAQRLKDAAAGMDAYLANELLVKSGTNSAAIEGFEERKDAFIKRITSVTENITYGDAERKPILALQTGFANYLAKAQQARDFHASGKITDALSAYRASAEIVDKTLLPNADKLDEVNLQQLQVAYDHQYRLTTLLTFCTAILGMSLIAILIHLQLFLTSRTRRMINPALLSASLITIGFLIHILSVLTTASSQLKVAKNDAFVSLHAMRQARAIAYGANADESRYLLDTANAAIHEQAFINKTDLIAKPLSNVNWGSVISELQNDRIPPLDGLFAKELENLTFAGERDAALDALVKFGRYMEIDREIRKLQQSGKRDQAIELCTGTQQGQSNWAFEEFKKAQQNIQEINEHEFDQAIKNGFQQLEGFEWKAPIALGTIAFLALIGLLPRLKEYSA